jgi:hypothetical protein
MDIYTYNLEQPLEDERPVPEPVRPQLTRVK